MERFNMTPSGWKIDGFAVVFQDSERSPAVGKWAAYPMTTNDGFGRTIIHDGLPIGEATGYDTAEQASRALREGLAEEAAIDQHLGDG